jgi:peptidoglycan hydrolase-like protein with peptidoglycan-binding domain
MCRLRKEKTTTMKKLFLVIVLSISAVLGISAQGTSGTATAAKTAEPAKKPAVFRPTKDQIKQVQTMLKDKKLYTGEATGTYNDDTRTGIKSFQKDNGLNPTGTLNRATLEKFGVELTETQKASPVLDSSFAKASTDTKPEKTKTTSTAKSSTVETSSTTVPKRPAPFRANVDQIKAAQKMMKDGKMYTGEETGKLDDATRDSLAKFQEVNGLKVTKTLNALTLEKMGIALTDKQKEQVAAQAAYDAAKKN